MKTDIGLSRIYHVYPCTLFVIQKDNEAKTPDLED